MGSGVLPLSLSLDDGTFDLESGLSLVFGFVTVRLSFIMCAYQFHSQFCVYLFS
jgi:hypothetical protein